MAARNVRARPPSSPRRAHARPRKLAARVVPMAEARRDFSDICSRAGYGHDTVVVTKRGKPLAAIVSVADLERYLTLEDEHAASILERAVATSRGTQRVSPV